MKKYSLIFFTVSLIELAGCAPSLSERGSAYEQPVLSPHEVNSRGDTYDGKTVFIYGRIASKVHPWEMKVYDEKMTLSGVDDACVIIKSDFLKEEGPRLFLDNRKIVIKGVYYRNYSKNDLDGCFVGSALIVDDGDLREKYQHLMH